MFSHRYESRQIHEWPKHQLAIKNNFCAHHPGDDLAIHYAGIIINFTWAFFPGLFFSRKPQTAFPKFFCHSLVMGHDDIVSHSIGIRTLER